MDITLDDVQNEIRELRYTEQECIVGERTSRTHYALVRSDVLRRPYLGLAEHDLAKLESEMGWMQYREMWFFVSYRGVEAAGEDFEVAGANNLAFDVPTC